MKRRFINLVLISAAIFILSAAEIQTASAQGGPPPPPREGPPLRVACAQDMQRLCPGLQRKDARQCLKANRAQLSAGCKAFFQEARARRAGGAMGAPPSAGGPPPPEALPPGMEPYGGGAPGAGPSGR
jgi:hypothetical protein